MRTIAPDEYDNAVRSVEDELQLRFDIDSIGPTNLHYMADWIVKNGVTVRQFMMLLLYVGYPELSRLQDTERQILYAMGLGPVQSSAAPDELPF